jgi:hypothetical protein
MTEPNTSEINSRANETCGETYGRLEKEAWKSGVNLTATEASICCLGVLLTGADSLASESARTSTSGTPVTQFAAKVLEARVVHHAFSGGL